MIWSHFRQKEWPRTRKRKRTATVSKPPSDNEKIQVLADVHAAQEPHASHPAAQGTGAIPKRQTRASASTSKSTSSDSDSSVK